MKTTFDLNDDLFRRAKTMAAEQGITLRELVERALDREVRAKRSGSFELADARFTGRGTQPGIEEGDWVAVRDVIYEGRGT